MLWFIWSLIIAGTVVIDRVTKYLTVEYLKPIGDFPLIEGWLHLSYVENTGAAFGMLKDQRVLFLVVSTIGILGMLGLLWWKGKEISTLGTVSLCMVIGGGLGNQIDRIIQGYVVDMVYVKIIDFAVFNAADAFVCVGVGLMMICCFTVDRRLLEDEPKAKTGKKTSESAPQALSEAPEPDPKQAAAEPEGEQQDAPHD